MSATLAILGGGQLAQMLGHAAGRLGVRCRALDPSPQACAARTCEMVHGTFDDMDALGRLVDGADALTFEFENVPPSSLQAAARHGVVVAPGVDALRVASDRLLEKRFFVEAGMRVPVFEPVERVSELHAAVARVGCPLMLKARSGGYDGRSQATVHTPEQAERAWDSIGRLPCLAERRVELLGEVSVVACRSRAGHTSFYPLVSNTHSNGILIRSEAPASVDAAVARTAEAWTHALMDGLGYTGVLALELFQTPEGLLANEFAPRVHNTGHWTIEGAATSQFENHVRSVLGMELGPTDLTRHSILRNLIGTMPPPADRVAAEGIAWHDYGKRSRAGRKLGHVTVCGSSPADAASLEGALQI